MLIDATMSAISEHGFSNLTLAKIAGMAGMTAGTVNFHFATKEALLVETLKHVSDEFGHAVEAACDREEDSADRLGAIVNTALSDEITEFRKVVVWYAFSSEVSAREDYHRICGERERVYLKQIESACTEIIAAAGKQNQLSARAISLAVSGMIDQIWQEILYQGDSYDRVSGRRECMAFLASIFPWCFTMPEEHIAENISELPSGLTPTLPSWIYSNDDFFELEKEKIFLPSWQLVCHTSDLDSPGRYVTFEFFNEKAFVIRTDTGEIKAFHNVCRHRAHILLGDIEGECDGRIVCPYHGWTYDLTGKRIAMGHPTTFSDHDAEQFGLVAIDCEIYHGFVFIRFRSEGDSVASRMKPVDEEFAAYRTEDMVNIDPDDNFWMMEVEVNWKNAAENFLEDYHFFIGHKGLAALMEDEYDREGHGSDVARLSHQMRELPKHNWSVEKYHNLLPDIEHLPGNMKRRWTYYGLYPNVYFDFYPDKMDFFQIIPVDANRSVLRGRTYELEDTSRLMTAVRYLNDRINHRVQVEDNFLTESVQHGISSSSYTAGILSDKEVLVKHFGEFIRSKIPEANLRSPPK